MLSRDQTNERAARELTATAVPAVAGEKAATGDKPARNARTQGSGVVIVAAAEVAVNGDVVLAAGQDATECERASRIVVVMPHTSPDGRPNIRRACSARVDLERAAGRIITDLAVIDVTDAGLRLRELAPGVSAREVQALTEAPLFAGPDLDEIKL